MLGNAIYRELRSDRKVKVEGWTHTTKKSPEGHEFVTKPWPDTEADLLINCAAMTDADACEKNPNQARAINAFLPEALARWARARYPRFIHVSTDAVYDDSKPGRRKETDQPNPQSVYAKTKLEGEGRVLAAYPEALVVRTTMFGWTLPTAPRPKFAETILAALDAREPIPLFRDAIFSPLHVDHLAECLLELAELDVSGVLNVGARHPVTKSDFGYLVAAEFGYAQTFIHEARVDDLDRPAKRTKNVGLDVKKFEKLLGN